MEGLTLTGILEDNARRFRDKPVMRWKAEDRWKCVTYGEFYESARDIGTGLARLGMKPQDRVALLSHNGPGWVISYFAILMSGGIIVPIDKELKASELKHILDDSAAKLIILSGDFIDTLCEVADLLPSLERAIILEPFLESKDGTMETRVSPLPEVAQLKLVHVDRLRQNETFIRHETEPNDLAAIIYTSGTTGRPKGVLLTNMNMISNIRSFVEHAKVNEEIHTLSILPINHVYEATCGILAPIYLGGTISFCESLKKVASNVEEVKPNFVMGVPALYEKMYNRIMRTIDSNFLNRTLFRTKLLRGVVAKGIQNRLGKDIRFISGGAALDPEIAQGIRNLGLRIYQGYGVTETSPVISFEYNGMIKEGSVGKPIPEVEVRIHDANDEGVGEILVKGPSVMRGYFNNPEASEGAFMEGWYCTGDLGCIDDEGFLYIKGRLKNLIVTANGKNVYPEEVEQELLKSPYIEEIMVYGEKISPFVEEVHALIHCNQDSLDLYSEEMGIRPLTVGHIEELAKSEVRKYGKNLAEYKRVKKFRIRGEPFPKTSTGKIKRFALGDEIAVSH